MDKIEQATANPGEIRRDIRPFCKHDLLTRARLGYLCGCGAEFNVVEVRRG